MKRLLLVLILLLLSSPAGAQAPQITTFTTSFSSVGREALANRSARVPVTWTTQDRPLVANLVFEQVLPDGSTINVELPRVIPYVASNGDGIAAPILPDSDVDQIVLRVSLVHIFNKTVYDTATINLPIVAGSGGGTGTGVKPTLTAFTVDYGNGVFSQQLAAGAARLPVTWTAINRPLTANLVFEQVKADGSVVNVELPRDFEWVNSSDKGVVAPVPPGGDANEIALRVRLVDLLYGRTYDQRIVRVPVLDESRPPVIRNFGTPATTIDREALRDGTARADVYWTVANRPAGTNLVFEQLLPDGRVRNAELPRDFVIVPSDGRGIVTLVDPRGDADSVTVQVRLVNLNDNATLALRRLQIPVGVSGDSSVNIQNFTVSPVSVGGNTTELTITWQVQNADSIRITVNNTTYSNLDISGTMTVDVAGLEIARNPFPVSIFASNAQDDTAGATIHITYEGGTTIVRFSANLLTVEPGGDVTFAWDINGGFREAYITWPPTGPQQIFQRVTNIEANSASFTYTLPEDWRGARTFWLVVNVTGTEQLRSVVEIEITEASCTATWAFDIDESTCPAGDAHVVGGAFQPFEGGMMLWVPVEEPSMYILFDDGSALRAQDTWNERDYTIAEEPPDGLHAPVRGFGFLWSTNEMVSNRLGWATEPERAYQVTWQESDDVQRWYMTLPDGRLLLVDGSAGYTWRIVR